jgi:hypothetical protein
VFDDEFSEESQKIFEEIRKGCFILVLSETTLRELDKAPRKIQEILVTLPLESIELVEYHKDIIDLRDAYIQTGVVGPSSKADAEHIASASYAEVDFVVSWNFKHIVHFEKIAGYNAVNLLHGYKLISIYSPKEVI